MLDMLCLGIAKVPELIEALQTSISLRMQLRILLNIQLGLPNTA